ncbi:DUF4157 domain-containing protein [Methylomicrobium sp. Wu6]|uniref:eCIS core domain-containing protein n=1 Tax=Methylomicrobium sp. Wu6 TaxID=3107928 RepID=UPI002DD63CCB|nr:DUF4157 domain-containing protein [Methylomicrobium sp. Wu6]MEC4748872.1 DUF4157 domain-containing protein [Methylomicrobium sp. Wu6]
MLRNSGSPLPDAIRSDMEPGFGQSFADVRVHNGIKAGESARAVQAQAYTVGRAIVFGPGRFDSGSQEGRNLIAHELAHVAEHPRGTALPSGALRIGTPHDGGEIRAEQASAAALNGRRGTSDLLSSGSPHWMRHRKLMINLRN